MAHSGLSISSSSEEGAWLIVGYPSHHLLLRQVHDSWWVIHLIIIF